MGRMNRSKPKSALYLLTLAIILVGFAFAVADSSGQMHAADPAVATDVGSLSGVPVS